MKLNDAVTRLMEIRAILRDKYPFCEPSRRMSDRVAISTAREFWKLRWEEQALESRLYSYTAANLLTDDDRAWVEALSNEEIE